MLKPTRPATGHYRLPQRTLPDLLASAVIDHKNGVAVMDDDVVFNYGELADAATRSATGLQQLGMMPGDTVVLQLPNWWETVVLSWAVLLGGAVVVPIVPIYRSFELRHILSQFQPAVVVAAASWRHRSPASELAGLLAEQQRGDETCGGRRLPRLVSVRGSAPGAVPLEQLLERAPTAKAPSSEPGDITHVLTTSGTTAQPKGVLHSHQTLLAEVLSVASWCRLGGDDRVFMASPLSHVTGLSYGIVLPAHLGAGVVLQDRWDPTRATELIERTGSTFTVAATPFLHGLTDAYCRRGRSSLRIFVCGGADIPADLVSRANRILGTRVVRTYGSSELPTSTMVDPWGDVDAAADSDGIPMGANEIRVSGRSGEAELEVRGPELFLGYVDPSLNEAAFTDDGYFRTGDLAVVGTSRELHIVGRVKDIVNRGGEKFSAAEIEQVLLTHPSVGDVAVVGTPDPVLGERVCACVVPAAGKYLDLESLRRHVLRAGLALQKAPERLVVLEELPRTASGKLQRYVIRDVLRGDRPGPVAGLGRPTE